MKLDILAFGAHPDDVELGCSGTLLRHIAAGKKTGIIDLTRGELGTRGTAETRHDEAAAATKLMGLHARENLGLEDGFFDGGKENLMKVIKIIRKYRPEIIIANAITDRHPDHGRAARLLADAYFYSGLIKIETQDDGKKQECWKPAALYHYIQDRYIKPDFVIDVTDFMEKKMEVVKAYKTQFYDPKSGEPETVISTKDFLSFLYARAAEMGRFIHVKYAEGFTTVRAPGVRSLFDID
jgi:bacillithiol biosynthesis deacetylase BshB1